jgi:pentapeptide MXKDX repeat protein
MWNDCLVPLATTAPRAASCGAVLKGIGAGKAKRRWTNPQKVTRQREFLQSDATNWRTFRKARLEEGHCNFSLCSTSHICAQISRRQFEPIGEEFMNKMIRRLMAMCLLAVSLGAFAQSSDTMKQDSMKHDDVKQDQMKNDQMKKDDTKKNAKSKKTKQDKTKKDDMKKDDNMKHDDSMKQN